MARADAEILATLIEALASLNQRVRNVESLELVAGPAGPAGPQGERGADGRDADPITDEQIKAAAAEWLTANITQPADGQDGQDGKDGQDAPPVTAEQIQLAVDLWFEFNAELVRGADGRDGRDGRDGEDGKPGIDGRNGINGLNGSNGADGVGIALVEQRDEGSFWITLDDGREYEIELPEPKRTSLIGGGGGGGVQEIIAGDGIAVDNTDPKRPIVSNTGGGGTARQEVYLGAPDPLPNYPALIFDAVTIDGQTAYAMRFNDGLA